MSRSVIVSAVRTPFGRLGGGLAKQKATELGAVAVRAALERAGVAPEQLEYVIMGQVLQAGVGQAPARQASIGAGVPKATPADTINKVCASSVRAVQIADLMIRAGEHEVVVAGGMESMSNAPYALEKARSGYRMGHSQLLDLMVYDGLTGSFDGKHMVEHAAAECRRLGITREEQDAWAARSHERALNATASGVFAEEIVAVGDVAQDEGPRAGTTTESLAALKPVFDKEGTVTAGNAPGVNDGASALVVTSEAFAKRHGLEILATIVGQSYVAGEFTNLPEAPGQAGLKVLGKAGRKVTDLKRIEINEAFSAVAVHSSRILDADTELVNVNGGAVALGHPIGASGGRIVGTLVHELRRQGGGLGLAAICSGGGHGDALLLEV